MQARDHLHKLFKGGLVLAGLTLAAVRPAPAADVLRIIIPSTTEGICSSLSPGVMSVLDKGNVQHVFLLKPGYIVPQGVTPGRMVKVLWHRRDDGLLETGKVTALPTPPSTRVVPAP